MVYLNTLRCPPPTLRLPLSLSFFFFFLTFEKMSDTEYPVIVGIDFGKVLALLIKRSKRHTKTIT